MRAAIGDDPAQERLALRALANAELVAVGNVALCEFVWASTRLWKGAPEQVRQSLLRLASAANVAIDRRGFASGMSFSASNADFADGMIAHDERELGGDVLVSFDRGAVSAARGLGWKADTL